jgi:hypothetical protein
VLDNYKGNDDILPVAQQKMDQLGGGKGRRSQPANQQKTVPDTGNTQPDTTKNN